MYFINTENTPGTNKQTQSIPVDIFQKPVHVYENIPVLNYGDELSSDTYQHTNSSAFNKPEHEYSKLNPSRQDTVETKFHSAYQNIPRQPGTDIVGPYETFNVHRDSVK